VSEGNEIVPISPNMAALMAAGGMGLEETFIKPTWMELLQRTSKRKDVRPGKLFDVLTSTEYDSVQAVALNVRRGRVYFPPGGDLTAKPICRCDGISPDGKYRPSEFAEFPQAEFCTSCAQSSWDNYDRKKGTGKPPCQEAWSMLFVLRETGLPRRINIKGTSLAPTKQLMEQVKQDIIMAKAKGEGNRNFFDYTFTISTQFVEGGKGSYYILKYTDVRRITNIGEFGPLFTQYVLSTRAHQEEKAATADSLVDAAVEAEVPVEV
jgi:hypothetical protein